MKIAFILFAISLLITGCSAARIEAAEKRISIECPPEKRGTTAKRNRCIRDIGIQEFQYDPGLPVLVAASEDIIAISEQYDSGKISKQRYLALKSDIEAKMNATISAYNAQANARAWQNVGQSMQEYSRQQAANRPRTTNCFGGPYGASCTTY